MKKLLKTGLVLGLIFSGFSAYANEEQSARAGQALSDWLNQSSEAPRTSVASGTLIIYRGADDASNGIATRVTGVARYKHYLFIYNEFGGPQAVPYITEAGAASDMARLVAGESIDVSGCMEDSKHLSSRRTSDDPICTESTYELKMSCSELTRVPLHSDAALSRYNLRDIEKSPLSETREHCVFDHGNRF